MRLKDLYQWLPYRSKAARSRIEHERLLADVLERQRQTQAHYRQITGSGPSGLDRRNGG